MLLYNFVILMFVFEIVAGERCGRFSGYYDENKFKDLERETGMKEMVVLDSVGKTNEDDDTSNKQNNSVSQVVSKNFLMAETLERDSSVVVLTKDEVENGIGKIDVKRRNFSSGDLENLIHLVYLFPLGDHSSDHIKTKWKKVSKFKLFNDKLDHFLFDMKMCQVNPVGYFVVKINESRDDFNYTNNDVKEDSKKEGTDEEIGMKIWNGRSKRQVDNEIENESGNLSGPENIINVTTTSTLNNEAENEAWEEKKKLIIIILRVAVYLTIGVLLLVALVIVKTLSNVAMVLVVVAVGFCIISIFM